jgi:hypothetical protein
MFKSGVERVTSPSFLRANTASRFVSLAFSVESERLVKVVAVDDLHHDNFVENGFVGRAYLLISVEDCFSFMFA